MTVTFSRYLSVALFTALANLTWAAPDAVDRVLFNARVYTVDDDQPWAEAVAIAGNRIAFVGDTAAALALAGTATERHDLEGAMLLPGFIDSHMHPVTGGAFARALSLDTFGTVDDWIGAIDAFAAAHPDAPLIFGYGFLATTFGPEGPTRQQIDAVVDERPVLIMDEGFHAAWANTRALEQLGIDRDTVDPVPGFSYYKRDAEGRPTGYLLEGTGSLAMDGLKAITDQTLVDGTAHVLDVLNSYGVTSVFDAGAIGYEEALPGVLRQLEDAGEMTVRIIGAYRPSGPGDMAGAVASARRWGRTIKGENYHYRMLKLMLDGTVEGRTAAMFEDYQGEPGNRGETVFSQQQTTAMVVEAAGEGIDIHIHALGERAVHQALNAIAAARRQHPGSATRYAICHIQVIADADLPRFAELGVIAQSTPLWASYDTYGKQFVSDDQFARYWRFRSLRDLGVRLTWGSDFPASGAGMPGMSPILQMEIGHTRQSPGEPEAPVQPLRSERLDMATLIRGYTLDAAFQLRMEDELGSIAVGKRADLVVLDKDLFTVEAYAIHRVRVLLTLKDGIPVYRLDD